MTPTIVPNPDPRAKRDLLMRNVGSSLFSILSGMPGRKRWEDRELVFEPSGANIAHVLEHVPQAEWTGSTVTVRDSYIALKMQEQNTVTDKQLEELTDDSGYVYKTKPFDHQRKAFILSRDKIAFALLHEQGCGKSKVAVDTAAYLYERGKIDTMIVVAPNGVHSNWILNEIPAHMPDRIPYVMDYYSSKKSAKKLEEINALKANTNHLRIIAFNVEGFASEKALKMLEFWLLGTKALLVVDESSKIKNPHAKRTKLLQKAGLKARYRRILTGSPITRGSENLYSQFKFLDSRILGYDSFYTFRARYCIMGGFENKMIVSYKHLDELSRNIEGSSHRVLKRDCLDLPPKIYKRIPFELSEEQRKLYNAVKKKKLEELQKLLSEGHSKKLVKELAITTLLRLQQIACGWMPQDTEQQIDGPHPRLEQMWNLIEECQGKMLIWCRFKADCRLLYKELSKYPDEVVGYWGEINEHDRKQALWRLQHDPKTRWFVASKAAAIGHTLTAATTSTYYSQDYDLEVRLQSEDRNHRIGTTIGTLYNDVFALNTIERRIISALRRKKNMADTILQDPTEIFMEETQDA